MARPKPAYRKPREYIPPYNYCDRWCERCRIDKACCMVYQSTTDSELEAVSEGRDTSSADFTADEARGSLADAMEMLGEMAREQGIDLEAAAREAEEQRPGEVESGEGGPKRPPLLEKAMTFSTDVHAFLGEHRDALEAAGREQGVSFDALFWHHTMAGPTLARILFDRGSRDPEIAPYVDAADILSAQVAHKALLETEAGLLQVMRFLPSLTDETIGYLARGKALREALEDGWLSRESALLEPVGDGPWWGPLENAGEALEHLREVRRKRKTRRQAGER
jgi:hypothetical protein